MQNLKNFLKVDFVLLPIKLHYFLFFTALASVLPFRTILLKQRGLSATAIGIIFLAMPILKIISNPLIGIIVDHFKKFRLTLTFLLILVAASHVAMVFVPAIHISPNITSIIERSFRMKALQDMIAIQGERYDNFYGISRITAEIKENIANISCEIKCHERDSTSVEANNTQIHRNLRFQIHFKEVNLLIPNTDLVLNYTMILEPVDQSYVLEHEEVFVAYNCTFIDISRNVVNITSIEKGLHNNDFHMQRVFTTFRNIDAPEEKHRFNEYKLNRDISLNGSSENSGSNAIIGNNVSHFEKLANCSSGNESGLWQIYLFQTYISTDKQWTFDISNQNQIDCELVKCANAQTINETADGSNQDEFLSLTFWSFFLLINITGVKFAAIFFLVDTVCYEIIGEKKSKYGFQRLWGSVGWGLGALIGGYLNQLSSHESHQIDFSWGLYFMAVLSLLDLIPVINTQVKEVKFSQNICKDMYWLLRKVYILTYIFMVFCIGALSGLIWNYELLFLQEIGATHVLLGLSQTVESLFAEVPCFLISGWLVCKIGYIHCNSLVLLCLGLRYMGFAYMTNPWLCLPLAFLQGPSFGIFYTAVTRFGKTEAPPGAEATMQSLLALLCEGLGVGVGSFIGGLVIDAVGIRDTLLFSGYASFVLLVINMLLQLLTPILRPQKPVQSSQYLERISTKL